MMKTTVILATSFALVLAFTIPAGALSLDLPFLMEVKKSSLNQTADIMKSERHPVFEPDMDFPEVFFQPEKDFSEITAVKDLPTGTFETDPEFHKSPTVDSEPNDGSSGPAPVPEPATLVLLGSGLIGITCLGRKKRRHHGRPGCG